MVTYTPSTYAEMGLAQLPVCQPTQDGKCGCGKGHTGKAIGKAALIRGGFRAATTDPQLLSQWESTFPGCNWGAALAQSQLVVVDTDSEEADLEVRNLGVPTTYTVVTGRGGRHRYYRRPLALPIGNAIHRGESGKIDLLSDGYVILPPSLHVSGASYSWEVGPDQLESSPPDLPDWASIMMLQSILGLPNLSLNGARLFLGLDFIPSEGEGEVDRSETLWSLACELLRAGASERKTQQLLVDRDEVLGASWAAGPKYLGRRDAELRYAETVHRARNATLNEPKLIIGSSSRRDEGSVNQSLAGLEKTDLGNATAMAMLYREKIAYNPAQQRWYRWMGHSWTQATDGDIQLAAAEVAKARLALSVASSDDKGVSWSLRSQDAYRIESAVKLAKVTLRREGAWDSNDSLLACANGVINLEDGELRPGEPEDLISMQTSVSYDNKSGCPTFDRFLSDVFGGKQDVVDWVWRALGYSLTGFTNEECLFLLHGTGSNGKGTFDWVMQQLLGSYYLSAPFATFEEQKIENAATNDLAMMAGRRVVSASEATEGKRLNEARIKRATGRDPITARFLHREFFTYVPRYKIWLQANHLPVIRGTDEGIWRRMRLVPFNVSFRGRENHKLRDELEAELPGILARAVHAASQWIREGGLRLEQSPHDIKASTKEYRSEMDVMSLFLEDCTFEDNNQIDTSTLYRAYRGWALDKGEYVLSNVAFGRKLVERGILRVRSASQRAYQGITLSDTGEKFAAKVL
jgi:putative DNA primase/helicase